MIQLVANIKKILATLSLILCISVTFAASRATVELSATTDYLTFRVANALPHAVHKGKKTLPAFSLLPSSVPALTESNPVRYPVPSMSKRQSITYAVKSSVPFLPVAGCRFSVMTHVDTTRTTIITLGQSIGLRHIACDVDHDGHGDIELLINTNAQ